MSSFLGIDTSNYTTSVAIYNKCGEIVSIKKILTVKDGKIGLRQSDAVFQHVKEIPFKIEELFSKAEETPLAIGVSKSPRDEIGSYMPCFEVGVAVARSIAAALKVPLYTFSHQRGHIVAALYSANKMDLLKEKFLAFHVSGGTTEAILVTPDDENIIKCEIVAKTLDLNAGQVIDRVGNMLGLPFPSGPELEKLSCKYTEDNFNIKPSIKGIADCCLSGVENKCQSMFKSGEDGTKIAKYAICYVRSTLDMMLKNLLKYYGDVPIVFAGGVMSNRYIQEYFKNKYAAYFAEPYFSSDNAVGTAILASLKGVK